MFARSRETQKGFTLIELLIVVAIIGIIAAILIPNLIDALQKAKQKRTMADMRNTGTAFLSWVTDQASAAAAGATTWDGTGYLPVDYGLVSAYLHPTSTFFYMQDVPQLDGWKHAYIYGYSGNPLASTVFATISTGRDGALNVEGNSVTIGPFTPTSYDEDIMWADGFFIRWPSGASTGGTPPVPPT